MRTKTEQILAVMNVLSLIVFIGLITQAGAILISYVVSTVKPEGAKDLYTGLNLYDLRQFSFMHYTFTVALKVALLSLKAYIANLLINVLSRIKIKNPFTIEISARLEMISYYIMGLSAVSMLNSAYIEWLQKSVSGLQVSYVSGEFVFVAGLVFVIAQIFKKGVELQTENELTV